MAFDKYQKDALRKRWVNLHRHCEVEFANYEDFLSWCEVSGWATGAKLMRRDSEKPYSRENCYWDHANSRKYEQEVATCAARWERCVGPFRKKYQDIIAEIQTKQQKQAQTSGREYFQYEHPDLVREGIVFEGSRSV